MAVGGELTGMESVYQIVFGLFSNEGLMRDKLKQLSAKPVHRARKAA